MAHHPVIAFHGQAASGRRLQADMGSPDWCDWYPDWQTWRNAQEFSEYLESQKVRSLVGVAYSLGGDFLARLTWEQIGEYLRGIVLYESPLETIPAPRPLPCPVLMIWNNYVPRSERRREGKAYSIAKWSIAYRNITHLVGRYTSHVVMHWYPPFVRHAWDKSLNGFIGDWIGGLR